MRKCISNRKTLARVGKILGLLDRRLRQLSKQRPIFHLLVSVDGREETGDEVLVEGLVLAHLVDGVPLLRRHPLLDRLRRVLHLRVVTVHLLVRGHRGASLRTRSNDHYTTRLTYYKLGVLK